MSEGSTSRISSLPPLAVRVAALGLACSALLLAFLGLLDWDVPLTRFVRSLNDFHIDHLANPWLARLSDVGDRLGRGESLVVISVVVLAVGFGLKQAEWKRAGWQSLAAHAFAALISNLVKHLVGRPRPKFMHSGQFALSPGTGSGWDSFPSGHATASFALAAVFATRFPRVRWFLFALAGAITLSRVLRGSHFLTDTVGGAVIGYTVGTVVANPLSEWQRSVEGAVVAAASVSAAITVVVWTIGWHPSGAWPHPQLSAAGLLVVALGLIGLGLFVLKSEMVTGRWFHSTAHYVVGLGFGMMTGSLWVTATVCCACAALWLHRRSAEARAVQTTASVRLQQVGFILFVLCALVLAIELRGILPMR